MLATLVFLAEEHGSLLKPLICEGTVLDEVLDVANDMSSLSLREAAKNAADALVGWAVCDADSLTIVYRATKRDRPGCALPAARRMRALQYPALWLLARCRSRPAICSSAARSLAPGFCSPIASARTLSSPFRRTPT